MASLVGQQLKDTYDSLLKTSDNDALGVTYKEITDGSGNGSNLYLGTGGNVGIGNTSPDALLHIGGSIPTSAEALNVRGNGPGIYAVSIEQDNPTGYGVLIDTDGTLVSEPALNVKNSSSSMLYVGSNGNVGIGDTNPVNGYLTIRGATTTGTKNGHIMLTGDSATNGQGPQIVFSESGVSSNYAGASVGYVRTGSNGIGDLVFGTRATSGDADTVPTEAMRIDSSGRVGIGETNPSVDLHISTARVDNDKHEILRLSDSVICDFKIFLDRATELVNSTSVLNTASGNMAFETSNTERMRIDSSGNVLVGTTSTTNFADKMRIVGDTNGVDIGGSSTTGVVRARGSDTGAALIDFTKLSVDPNSSPFYNGRIFYSFSDNHMRFETNSAEAMRIDSSGNVSITTGNLILDSGAGIDFSDTADATGMTSELLDDYEEGTWTPVLSGSGTAGTYEASIASGSYIKVGNMVNITARITLAGSITGGGTGYAKITGVPFAKGADMSPYGSVRFVGVDIDNTGLYANVAFTDYGASSILYFPVIVDNANSIDQQISGFSATDTLGFSITYFV